MEVTCSRCQSVYDFEDTLVSTKGVVVRCTHCGHLFKVFPPDIAPAAAEESGWMLRREDGTVFAIDRFSTLQKWIAQAKVTRRDELSRTGESWKRLGDIIELAPFFETVGRQAGRGRAEPTLAAAPAPSAVGRGAEREHLEIPLAYQSMVPPAEMGVPSVPPDERVEETPFRIEAAAPARQEAAPFAVFAVADVSRADTAPARPSRKPVMPPGEVRLSAEPEPEEDLPRRRRGMAWLVLLLVVVAGAAVAGVYHRQIGLFFRRVTGTDPDAATETERILEKAARLFSAETAGSVRQAEVEYDRVLRFNIGDTRALGGLLEMRTMRAQYARDELDVALLLGMPDKDPREVERLRAAFDTEMARAREMALGLPAPGGDTAGLGAEALRALADMERLRGDRERAADLLGAALAIDPEDPRSLHVRAMLVMDDALSSPDLVGATAEVEAAFGRALAADAGRDMVPRARIHLALYLALVGRRDEAAAQVRCVIEGGSACPGGRGAARPDHLLAGKVGAWLSLLPAGIAGPVPPALPSHTVVQPSGPPAEAPDAGPEIVPAEAPDVADPAAAIDVPPEAAADEAPEAPAPADAKPEAPAREATPPETPTSVEGLLDAAKQALEYGSTARAISLLQQALRIDPTNSEALVNLGYAYLDAGRRADARQQFERANQVSGGHPDALLGIGDILVEQGSLDAALDAYRRALGRARTPYQRRIAERKVRDLEERLGVERGPAPAPAPIEAGPPESQPVGPP